MAAWRGGTHTRQHCVLQAALVGIALGGMLFSVGFLLRAELQHLLREAAVL